jgi:hypothetical protein
MPADAVDAELHARLAAMDKDGLVALAAQLLTTYVVEGLATQSTEAKAYDLVGEETFAGLLQRLKAERPRDPVLEKFVVNGEHIQVKTPMGAVDVTEYRRPAAPAAAPGPSAPAPNVPTSRDSVYNRALYDPAAAAGPARPVAPPAPPPGPAPAPRVASAAPALAPGGRQASASPKKDEKDSKTGERFRLIELD